MANKRITELPTGSPPSGAELLELVQGGVNVKLTAQEIADLAAGGGAVDSVNGQTGVVVLDYTDVGADASGAASAALSAAQSYADAKIENTIVDGVTDRAPSQGAVYTALQEVRTGSNLFLYYNFY